jgi:hypothetical protein
MKSIFDPMSLGNFNLKFTFSHVFNLPNTINYMVDSSKCVYSLANYNSTNGFVFATGSTSAGGSHCKILRIQLE